MDSCVSKGIFFGHRSRPLNACKTDLQIIVVAKCFQLLNALQFAFLSLAVESKSD